MSAEVLSTLMARSIALTPKAEPTPKKVTYKVFWKTTALWTDVDIAAYHDEAPLIAEKLISEQYWDKNGAISNNKFTCEDFALRMLCEFSAKRGLPVKLKTGVRVYRNMENYNAAEHDRYASNMYGFSEMVMLTYGAPDMQKTGENTLPVAAAENLMPGDILAQALDRPGDIAHHIQVVVGVSATRIDIRQGDTGGWSTRPYTTFKRMIGSNMADPQNDGYAGLAIGKGFYEKKPVGWSFHNLVRNSTREDFLKIFQLYRWNFMGFNK
ncbi:hypothetical protein SAMN03159489_05109 [Pseudomonas sp. NFPP07]|uniref:hypothetical protein n=1 Tax=Pseudomonas sp. NFPP07 TaxID=1566213 RepID=UPI0008E3F8CC|nr:hypothetical protein [Pseudomonas sp. NFPP07]SFQ72878.1 hypothetical protein SAMN03159489_05109 [Pseudomonas sp. NFPP07]